MITIPLEPFYVWLMVFLRTAFIIGFFPLFGEGFVPVRVRLILAAVVAAALSPVVGLTADMFPKSAGGTTMMIFSEALLGFSLGMIGKVMFAIVQYAGQLAGEQMGFGLVNAIDPTGSHQISVVAEMMYLMAILVFLTADLHHAFLNALGASYQVLPPGAAALNGGVTDFMMRLGTALFDFSLRLAMPVILIIFAINISLGMIARAVPQINVFLESFPLRIIAGLAVLTMSLGFTVTVWENLFGRMDGLMANLMRLLAV